MSRGYRGCRWLALGEMVRGLAPTETTPAGPLIVVDPWVVWVAAVLVSMLVTWVPFVSCVLFIFLGAPYVERVRDNRHLTAAPGITAAVVGVIANLAVSSRCTSCSNAPARSSGGRSARAAPPDGAPLT